MKKALFFISVLLMGVGCDKNEDSSTPSSKTKSELLTQATWKFQAAGIDMDKNGVWETTLANVIPDCAKDNTVTFTANGTGTSGEGTNVCPNASSSPSPFTWSFVSGETVLSITGNAILGYGGQYKIVSLTDTKLSLSKDTTISGLGSQPLTVVADFVH